MCVTWWLTPAWQTRTDMAVQTAAVSDCVQARFVGSDGRARQFDQGAAFREADLCWSQLSHVTMLRYRVRNAEDAQLDIGRSGSWLQAQSKYTRDAWERFRIWDASVRVRGRRLGDLVAEGLAGTAYMWLERR